MLTSLLARPNRRLLHGTRRASTTAKSASLQRILQRKPDDVVITFAQRTAMGRAKKGQLKDVPVDELLHGLLKVREPT